MDRLVLSQLLSHEQTCCWSMCWFVIGVVYHCGSAFKCWTRVSVPALHVFIPDAHPYYERFEPNEGVNLLTYPYPL